MGGGRGTRLQPLTIERCKPAVPLAGKYRLVDIPISNCLNSGLNQIYVLTQFNTASLHRHIQEAYKFDPFGGGFVDIMSAEQTQKGDSWYQGTADAVRQNLHHLGAAPDDLILILSGDQLYQMDFEGLINQHIRQGSDITVAAKAIPRSDCEGLGLMRVADSLQIKEFAEKPKDPAIVDNLVVGKALARELDGPAGEEYVLANMGIYCFSMRQLRDALANDYTDFGKEIIPEMLRSKRLDAFVFQGYWEDIGTVRSFFDANLSLADENPPFNFFSDENRIYTRARFLPASKLLQAHIDRAIIAGGVSIEQAKIQRSVVGVRSKICKGSELFRVVMMGADWFESNSDRVLNRKLDRPDIGIGEHCTIEGAIVDKNARIGDNVRLSPDGKEDGTYEHGIVIRDGVLIVTKNSVVPPDTVF